MTLFSIHRQMHRLPRCNYCGLRECKNQTAFKGQSGANAERSKDYILVHMADVIFLLRILRLNRVVKSDLMDCFTGFSIVNYKYQSEIRRRIQNAVVFLITTQAYTRISSNRIFCKRFA